MTIVKVDMLEEAVALVVAKALVVANVSSNGRSNVVVSRVSVSPLTAGARAMATVGRPATAAVPTPCSSPAQAQAARWEPPGKTTPLMSPSLALDRYGTPAHPGVLPQPLLTKHHHIAELIKCL